MTAFWYWKGWSNIKIPNYTNAIECFKQTLINDENHFLSIFIISCLYELLGFYKTSLEWFEICMKKKKFKRKVCFGLALCHFKLHENESASKYLQKIFINYQKDNLMSEFIYLNIINQKKTNVSRFTIINEYKYFKKR